MRDWGRRRLYIGLAADGIGLVLARGWPRRAVVAQRVDTWPDDAAPAGAQWAERLSRLLSDLPCRGASAHVVLADDLVRHWMVTPPTNARRPADCRAAAAGRFQALYGEAIDGWRWDADWSADRIFLATALPLDRLALLQQACEAQDVLLLTVTPELVAAWNRHRRELKPQAWFGAVHGRRMTLAAVAGAEIGAVRRLVLPDGISPGQAMAPDWLRQTVQREAERWMLDAPSRLQCCGAAAAEWAAAARPDDADAWVCEALPAVDPVAARVDDVGLAQRPSLQLALAGW